MKPSKWAGLNPWAARLLSALLLCVIPLVASCRRNAEVPTADLSPCFPDLPEGTQREFLIHYRVPDNTPLVGRLHFRVEDTQQLGSHQYRRHVSTVTGIPGFDPYIRYLRRTTNGIFVVLEKDPDKTEFLEIPFPLPRPGKTWEVANPEGRRIYKMLGTEDVTIGPHKFPGSVRLSYEGGNVKGLIWFAPDVGEIRGSIQDGTNQIEYVLQRLKPVNAP